MLSREQVRSLQSCVRTAHNRGAFLAAVYACAEPVNRFEALHRDVFDSDRMMLHHPIEEAGNVRTVLINDKRWLACET